MSSPMTPNTVCLVSSLTHDEVARLVQAGGRLRPEPVKVARHLEMKSVVKCVNFPLFLLLVLWLCLGKLPKAKPNGGKGEGHGKRVTK